MRPQLMQDIDESSSQEDSDIEEESPENGDEKDSV